MLFYVSGFEAEMLNEYKYENFEFISISAKGILSL